MRIEMRTGAEDLRDIAIDQLAGLGLLKLVANGNLAALSQQFADVRFGRVMWNPAHRDAVAIGQREVEQLRPGLGVIEKHLVKIAQPEQQQRIRRNLVFDAPILLHHRRQAIARRFAITPGLGLGFSTRHRGLDYSGGAGAVTT